MNCQTDLCASLHSSVYSKLKRNVARGTIATPEASPCLQGNVEVAFHRFQWELRVRSCSGEKEALLESTSLVARL